MRARLPLLVAVAPVGLVIGALIVGRPVSVPDDLILDPVALSTTSPTTVAPIVTEPAPVPSASTAPPTSSTTTAAPAEPVALDAVVLVANASSLSGVATRNAGVLTDAGFTDVSPTDATPSAVSTLYAREGFEVTATEIASLLGLPVSESLPFPVDPITTADDTADVLVVIGADIAGAE